MLKLFLCVVLLAACSGSTGTDPTPVGVHVRVIGQLQDGICYLDVHMIASDSTIDVAYDIAELGRDGVASWIAFGGFVGHLDVRWAQKAATTIAVRWDVATRAPNFWTTGETVALEDAAPSCPIT